MDKYKRLYQTTSAIVYAAVGVLEKATPHTMDDAAWEKWEAARSALYAYGSQLRAHPFNPVVAEAHTRGDFEDFLVQLERGSTENRKRKGWTKKQVRRAIPIIRQLAEEVKDTDNDGTPYPG